MTPEEHKRIVNAGIKKIGVRPREFPDIERLVQEGQRRIKNVRDYASNIAPSVDPANTIDRNKFTAEIMGKYLDNFTPYNKDELLHLFATFLTQITLKEVI